MAVISVAKFVLSLSLKVGIVHVLCEGIVLCSSTYVDRTKLSEGLGMEELCAHTCKDGEHVKVSTF